MQVSSTGILTCHGPVFWKECFRACLCVHGALGRNSLQVIGGGARGSQRERVLAFEALLSPGGDHPFFPDEEFHYSVGRDPHSKISVPTDAGGDPLSHTLCGNAREPQDLCT